VPRSTSPLTKLPASLNGIRDRRECFPAFLNRGRPHGGQKVKGGRAENCPSPRSSLRCAPLLYAHACGSKEFFFLDSYPALEHPAARARRGALRAGLFSAVPRSGTGAAAVIVNVVNRPAIFFAANVKPAWPDIRLREQRSPLSPRLSPFLPARHRLSRRSRRESALRAPRIGLQWLRNQT